jgi:hypothetical protein
VTSVDLFAVPPGADAEFLADWGAEERAAALYRALRDDADFRFAAIGPDGPYAVASEEGAPDTEGGCLQIEPFEVPASDDAAFLTAWDESRAALAGRRGYLGARLLHADAETFRFVGLTRWSSPLMAFRAGTATALYQ